MADDNDDLVSAVWDMMPRGTVDSEPDVEYLIKEENHDIDVETVDFALAAD